MGSYLPIFRTMGRRIVELDQLLSAHRRKRTLMTGKGILILPEVATLAASRLRQDAFCFDDSPAFASNLPVACSFECFG